VNCNTIEQMRLANALCQFAELAPRVRVHDSRVNERGAGSNVY
jgi:hypothetical protein